MSASTAQTLAPERPVVRGVVEPTERQEVLQRRAALVLTILPLVGAVAAMWSLWGRGLSAIDLGLFLTFYVVSVLGVTVGYHRYFTHGSFRTVRPVRVALAVAGSMGVQGSVIGWVATHRRHHAYADAEGDPHSPHLTDAEGVVDTVKGLIHAHTGWLFEPDGTVHERWAPDLVDDPDLVRIDRAFGWIVAATLLVPALLGGLLSWSLWGAVTGFLWGGLARVFLVHHVTWSINSICHFYGKQPFESRDESTNNAPLAILSLGESWHNNHHAFPTSARHGLLRGQVDLSWTFIKTLRATGLATDVKVPTPAQMDKKRVEPVG